MRMSVQKSLHQRTIEETQTHLQDAYSELRVEMLFLRSSMMRKDGHVPKTDKIKTLTRFGEAYHREI